MKVRYTETARFELEEIGEYIASDNIAAARALVRRIKYVIDRIGEFPEMATQVGESKVRIFPVPPFPYLIFYTVERGEVIIRNVRHAGRDRR